MVMRCLMMLLGCNEAMFQLCDKRKLRYIVHRWQCKIWRTLRVVHPAFLKYVSPFYGHIKPAEQRTIQQYGTLAVDGWAVTFGTVRKGLGGLRPRPVRSSLSSLSRLNPVHILGYYNGLRLLTSDSVHHDLSMAFEVLNFWLVPKNEYYWLYLAVPNATVHPQVCTLMGCCQKNAPIRE